MLKPDRYPVLDEAEGHYRQSYDYTRVVKIAERRVRVQVNRDFYAQQSYATAHVLADDMTWTVLATAAPSTWLNDTPPPGRDVHVDPAVTLGPIATRLLDRAAAILA